MFSIIDTMLTAVEENVTDIKKTADNLEVIVTSGGTITWLDDVRYIG